MPTRNRETLASRLTDCQSDAALVELWLVGKSPHTRDAYRRDLAFFEAFTENKPLGEVRMEDVAAFSEAMLRQGYAAGTVRRRLYAVKSLFSFAQKVGYLPLDAAKPLEVPASRQALAERILPESNVLRLIEGEPKERNRLLLRFLYETGCRVSELCGVKWKHLQVRQGSGQVNLFGKGSRTRAVLLTPELWSELQSFRGRARADDPVFSSKSGRHLAPRNVYGIVSAAAKRVGIEEKVSPHWLRHAHASHALQNGCPIHLIQATLGHASVATTGLYLHAQPQESSARYLRRSTDEL